MAATIVSPQLQIASLHCFNYKTYVCNPMKNLRLIGLFLAAALLNDSLLAQFTLNFSVPSAGEVELGFSSESNYYYRLEKTDELGSDFLAASAWLRGNGSRIGWPVYYDAQQSSGGSASFTGETFSLYPFSNGKTLVTWSDSGSSQYNALVDQDYSTLPPLLSVTESNAGPSMLLLVGRLNWEDSYLNLTANALPPAQQTRLSNFVARRAEVLAATNGTGGTGVSTTGEKQFFRVRRFEADADQDNLDWAVEVFELGSDPDDPSDGLFPPVQVSTWFDPTTGVDLSWQSASNGTEAFKIERREVGTSNWTLTASVTAGGRTWHDGTVVSPTIYAYRIYAVRGTHISTPSTEAIAASSADSDGDSMPDWWEVSNQLLPFDPTDATANPDGDALVNVEEYYNDRNPHFPDDPGPGNWGPAGRDGGEIPDPEVSQYLETIEPLDGPSGLTYQVIPSGQQGVPPTIRLSWTDNSDHETGYTIQFSDHTPSTTPSMDTDNSKWRTFAEVSANITSYEWPGNLYFPTIIPQLEYVKEYRVLAQRVVADTTIQSAPSNVVNVGGPTILISLSKPRDSTINAGSVTVSFAGQQLVIGENDLVDYGAQVGYKIAWTTASCAYGDTFHFNGSISSEASFSFSSNFLIFGGPSYSQNALAQNAVNVAGVAQAGPERIRASVAGDPSLLVTPDVGGLQRPLMVYPTTQIHLELLDGRGNLWTPAEPSSEVRWYSITRQGWNAWSNWKEIGRASTLDTSFGDPGIFHVMAVFGVPNLGIEDPQTRDADFFYYGVASHRSCRYNRISDESKMLAGQTRPKMYGPGRIDALDFIGVTEHRRWVECVRASRSWFLSESYAKAVANGPWGIGSLKCNQFVGHRLRDAIPGLNLNIVTDNQGTRWPMANEWRGRPYQSAGANTAALDSQWDRWEETKPPIPGYVVAHGRPGPGHVGITDYDGVGIAAGKTSVHKEFDFYLTNWAFRFKVR